MNFGSKDTVYSLREIVSALEMLKTENDALKRVNKHYINELAKVNEIKINMLELEKVANKNLIREW